MVIFLCLLVLLVVENFVWVFIEEFLCLICMEELIELKCFFGCVYNVCKVCLENMICLSFEMICCLICW